MNLFLIISYALVTTSVVPVRSEPDYAAEQETQLLFAETCQITEEGDGWCKIVNDYDGQKGWVENQHLMRLTEEEYEGYVAANANAAFVAVPRTLAKCKETGETIPLSIGTRLPFYRNGRFSAGGKHYTIQARDVAKKPFAISEKNIRRLTKPLMNTPYLWGGKCCMGYDCSGFSNVVMSLFGIRLLRNAREQATQGKEISSIDEAQAGDLVFFNHVSTYPEDTTVTHVGIMLADGLLLHCAGKVHIDRITPEGLISISSGKKTHDIAKIRRYQ